MFFEMFLDDLKQFIGNDVLDAAGIFLRDFPGRPHSDKCLGKDAVLFVDVLRLLLPRGSQRNVARLIDLDQSRLLQQIDGARNTRFGIAKLSSTMSTERTLDFFARSNRMVSRYISCDSCVLFSFIVFLRNFHYTGSHIQSKQIYSRFLRIYINKFTDADARLALQPRKADGKHPDHFAIHTLLPLMPLHDLNGNCELAAIALLFAHRIDDPAAEHFLAVHANAQRFVVVLAAQFYGEHRHLLGIDAEVVLKPAVSPDG